FAAQIAAHALGDGLVHRAGVGLLLGKPDGGEGVEDDARFDLELPREIVDADVCHAQLPNFVLRPLLPPMLLLPLQRFLRRRLRPGLGRFRLTGGVEPSGFAFGVGFLGGGRIGRRLQAVPRRKLGLIGQRGIEHAPLLLGLEFLTGAIQFAIHSGGEFGLCGAGLRAGLTLVDRLREGTEEFIHGDKNLFDRLGAYAGNLLELLRGAAAQLFDAGDAGPSEGSDDALAQADEGSQRGLDRLPLAHQRRHLLFDLAPLLLFALDINLPAEQLGGEADVLPLLADGEGELAVVHHDLEMAGFGAEHAHAGNLGRTEVVGGKLNRVLAELDDVNFFAAQLADDALHPHALHADAGTDAIHVLVAGNHRDLGALAGLAGDALDDHGAVINFWHFGLEEFLHQRRIGAGDGHLRPLGRAFDAANHHADALAIGKRLEPGLIAAPEPALGVADFDHDIGSFGAFHGDVHHLTDAADVLVVHGVALGLADLLKNDLLGHLRADAPEAIGRAFQANFATDFRVGVQRAGLVKGNLEHRIGDRFDDLFHRVYRDV